MRALRGVAAAAALVAALAGCASSGSTHESGGSNPPPRAATSLRVGAGDDGHTVHVSVGDRIRLRLTSTYWQVAKAEPADVLRTIGRGTQPAMSHGCVAGQGCGVVTASFVAQHPGKSVIAASRMSCGEALRCSPAQGTYRVKVVVQA